MRVFTKCRTCGQSLQWSLADGIPLGGEAFHHTACLGRDPEIQVNALGERHYHHHDQADSYCGVCVFGMRPWCWSHLIGLHTEDGCRWMLQDAQKWDEWRPPAIVSARRPTWRWELLPGVTFETHRQWMLTCAFDLEVYESLPVPNAAAFVRDVAVPECKQAMATLLDQRKAKK